MVVRIKLAQTPVSPAVKTALSGARELRPLAWYLIRPVLVAAYSLAAWGLGAELGWTSDFFVSRGLFSHWQVWFALAIAVQIGNQWLTKLEQSQSELGEKIIIP